MQKVTVTPLADITSLMDGTTAPWYWRVETVYVNGVSTAFSWSAGAVSIPSYTSGVVLVEFTLYLLYDAPSQNFPSDPQNPLSPVVYWENRLTGFISYSTSMKAFETGLTDVNVGSIGIQLDDETMGLARQILILANRTIRVYQNDQLKFKGISTKHSVNSYVINVNIQKRITVFDSECNFGDPAYLNRIDRSSNTAYYNGANIPEEFEGVAIPMFFGPEFPYDQSNYSEIDVGKPNNSYMPANSHTKYAQKNIQTNSFIARVIPLSSTVGLIGRMPSFQNLVSAPSDITTGGGLPSGRFYERSENILTLSLVNSVIHGETIQLFRFSDSFTNIARIYAVNFDTNNAFAFLGIEDASFASYNNVSDYSTTEHWFTTSVPASTWTLPAVSSGGFTPAGNRWITANFTGIDLKTNQVYVVFTGITGARSHFEIMKWILERHGFSGLAVSAASFSTLAAEFPAKTIQQIGNGNTMPTVGQVIGEMNRTYMTALVFPQSNDVPFIKKIDADEPATITLNDKQISEPQVSNEYRTQAKNVMFRPLYARSDVYKYSLFRNYSAPNATLFASEKTQNVDHVIQSVDAAAEARWQQMAAIFGSPVVGVKFDLFDDDVELEQGDMVFIGHRMFRNKIMITSIENRPIGRSIEGRYLYVNAD